MKLSDLDSVIDFFAENDTYIDTNAVMNYGFETLMRNCSLKLKERGTKIFICHSVMNELKKLAASNNIETALTAKLRLTELEIWSGLGIIEFDGNPEDKHPATQHHISIVIKHRTHRKLAVITCNRKLAHDILMQNNLQSFNGNHTYVFNISKSGFLYDYEEGTDTTKILKMFGLE